MNENRHLLPPTLAYVYVAGGRGTFTLVGKQTRYTYKLSQHVEENFRSPIFVKVLVGSDNTNDFEYIGFIPDPGPTLTNMTPLQLKQGKKGNAAHPAYTALAWWLEAYRRDPELAAHANFWHEGTCCRCGRKLTVPESIEAGIGPVCAGLQS